MNDWKDRIGVVYSTSTDFEYTTSETPETETLPPQQQRLRVSIEKTGRSGKTATIVKGFVGREEDLKTLGRLLKTRCGVGGSVKNSEIILQGNLKDKVITQLKTEGYKDTK